MATCRSEEGWCGELASVDTAGGDCEMTGDGVS